MIQQLDGNGLPQTAYRLIWTKLPKEDVRRGSLTRQLRKGQIVEVSHMAIDRIQRRGFVRDIVSLASNNLDRFLHKSLVSASIISIKSAGIFAYSE